MQVTIQLYMYDVFAITLQTQNAPIFTDLTNDVIMAILSAGGMA